MSPRAPRVETRSLTEGDWPAVEELFGERGACGGCWCMAWRRPGREWERHRGTSNKRAFKRLVVAGEAHGVIARVGDEVVGWCSLGPRADFRSLETKRSLRTDWDETTWSVTCFFIARGWRGRGIARKLLAEAVVHARRCGARRLEGYPAPLPASGEPLSATFAWTGVPRLFESQGFRALEDVPGKRPIYVRRLRRGALKGAAAGSRWAVDLGFAGAGAPLEAVSAPRFRLARPGVGRGCIGLWVGAAGGKRTKHDLHESRVPARSTSTTAITSTSDLPPGA